MDFIEQLPDSSGYMAILVAIDRLTKQSIFILTHDTITSTQLAQLFVLHVFSKHRVLSHITSDRCLEIISCFFRSLGKALDMTLHFKAMDRLNTPIKLWNNTHVFTVITNRTIGLIYYP